VPVCSPTLQSYRIGRLVTKNANGFVVMPWKTSLLWGLIMLGLFIVQIIANLKSHPKMSE
jgi:hypothetical protein